MSLSNSQMPVSHLGVLPGKLCRPLPQASTPDSSLQDFIAICLSSHAIDKTGFVHREMKMAMDVMSRMPDGAIKVIPVRLDLCDVPRYMARLHRVDLFDADGLDKLCRAISSNWENE